LSYALGPGLADRREAIRPRHPYRGHRTTDYRNHQLIHLNQHLRLQSRPGEFTPQVKRRPFNAAFTLHGSAFLKGVSMGQRAVNRLMISGPPSVGSVAKKYSSRWVP